MVCYTIATGDSYDSEVHLVGVSVARWFVILLLQNGGGVISAPPHQVSVARWFVILLLLEYYHWDGKNSTRFQLLGGLLYYCYL